MFEKYPELVTIEEMMEMLRIGRNKAYTLISDKKVKSVGRPYRIVKSSIIKYIEKSN